MRRWIIGLGLVLGAAGCTTGSSGGGGTPLPSTAVSSAASSAAASASASVSQGASAAASGPDAFLSYVKDKFPGATWVQSVRSIQIVDGRAEVDTTLTKDSGGTQVAQQVCTAARAYLPTGGSPLTGATVLDQNGRTILEC